MRTPHIAAIIAAATPEGLLYADEVRTLIGEIERLEARVAEMEAQNARLRTALLRLNRLYLSCFDYDEIAPKPEWLKAALAGTEEAK